METRKYLKDAHLLDILPEDQVPLKLTTINNDCKELIFDYLEWQDLINIADSSKQLYIAACGVFKRKYGNSKIDFFFTNEERTNSRTKLVIPDILVLDGATALKILRNFGHLIAYLNIAFSWFKYELQYAICDYLAEYSFQSLVKMSVLGLTRFFQYIQKPFPNVKSLFMDECIFGRELPFNRIFPNLQSLKLGDNQYENPSAIKMHFFSLTDLSIYDFTRSFDRNDVDEFLQLNPQLEILDLRLGKGYCVNFIQRLKNYCPNLKQLGLGWPDIHHNLSNIDEFEPTHLNQIEKLTLKDIWEMSVPFTFSKLKYLEIGSYEEYIRSTDISVFIEKNPHLTSLKFELSNIIDLTHFFRIENLLMNIEELSIGVLKQDIPSDDLIYFLTRNRSLKRFSLTARFKNIQQFYNAVISMDTEFKIRNKAIEFIVTRKTDYSSIKYVLRVLIMGSLPFFERDEDREDGYLFDWDYPYNNRLVECCSYDESPHLISQMYDEYINVAVNCLHREILRSRIDSRSVAIPNIGPRILDYSTQAVMSYSYY